MMNYQIKYSNDILYDLRDKELFVESPNLNLEINKVGTLTFSIYPDHPYFDKLEKLKPKVVAKRGNKDIFRGRIVNDEQGIYNEKNIECESSLSYLNDSIYRPSSFSGTPEELFTLIINNHNSQVTDEQKLKKGNVTVTDPNNYISRSWEDYLSSWNLLKTRLLDTLGGYLVERYEDDGTYIDWLEDFKNSDNLLVSTQTIEFGENLIDILAKNDAANTYSVVIPLGYEIEAEDGTKSRLTINSVNDNKDYLVNETALDLYGWRVAPVEDTTWDDVTLASNLKTKGQNYLNNQAVMIASTLDITALDLAVVDKDIEFFFVYKYVRIKSTPHNFNKVYLLKSIKIPFDHPESTQITLGETSSTLTGIELGNKQKIDDTIKRIGIVEKNYSITDEKLSDLENAIEYFSVDLAQYNLTIPTDSDKKPLETTNYDIPFYAYFKGQQITPTVSISGSNTGITPSKTNTYLRFGVSKNTAITNITNEYEITFTYTVDSKSYSVKKIVDIVLALKGSDGKNGTSGTNGKSAYQIWLDAGNTGTEEDYLASLKGQQGIQGAAGKDGTSYYFYVRYSVNSNGNPMTVAPSSNSKYMGVASTTSSTAPTSYSAYTWSLIKGADGTNGSPGQAGADGKSSYLHIKYSDDGTTFTANAGEDVGRYRGELVDDNPTDSTTFSDYTWYDMALLVEDELNEIRQEVQTNITSIQQNQEQILMTALQEYVSTGDFDTFKQTISTQFEQTAAAFNFNFNNITSEINTINGTTQAQFQEISKYIRFENGNIILGEAGNEITLKIENDRISFLQNNSEVAYLSNNKLVVTDGEFLNSLIIGNFAWKPRENGNLSLVKIGGGS